MNIFEKLQCAREILQAQPMKKSGNNKFAGYQYFELGDFLPSINLIFLNLKICSVVSFGKEIATLQIINIEKPEEVITFTSPMAEAHLKGCHPIQNLGAVETYSRRYLYVTALEIVEHDALDSSPPVDVKVDRKPAMPVKQAPIYLNEGQIANITSLAAEVDVAIATILKFAKVESLDKVPLLAYAPIIKKLEEKRETA